VLVAYRLVFEQAGIEQRRLAVSTTASKVREGSGAVVDSWTEWFLLTSDLRFASDADKELLVDYLLGQLQANVTVGTLDRIRGVVDFISPAQVPKLLDRIVLGADRGDLPKDVRAACWDVVTRDCCVVPGRLLKPISNRFEHLAKYCESKGLSNHAARIRNLRVEEAWDPFSDD